MLSISKEKKMDFISTLETKEQRAIKKALTVALQQTGEYTEVEEKKLIKEGMLGRICDLEDTIEIRYV